MKKTYILLAISAAALSMSACNDFLDTVPDQRAELDSEKKISQLLVSAYPECSFNLLAECSSDNISDNGTVFSSEHPQIAQAYLWKNVEEITYDTPYELWDNCYQAVMTCNTVLDYIKECGNPVEWRKYRAEALICRAYSHFVLVNIFCHHYNEETSATDLGIPYIEIVEKEIFIDYDRETVKKIYEKIDRDIEEALPDLEDSYYNVPSYRFNVRAAHAFAARFNLYYMKDMQKVVDYATIAIGNNPAISLRDYSRYVGFNSWGDWGDAYIDPSQECNLMLLAAQSIWARVHAPYAVINRRYTHNQSISRSETYGSMGIWNVAINGTTGKPEIKPNADYVYGALFGNTVSRASYPKIKEYFVVVNPVLQTGNAMDVFAVFTTDEALLCRAEAYAHMKEYDKAIADLVAWNKSHGKERTATDTKNMITALYGPDTDFGGIKKELNPKFPLEKGGFHEALIHCILHTRRVETVGDGLRWFDIKRYGISVFHQVAGEEPMILEPGDPRFAIQLPSAVIASGMEPNPR